MHERPGVIILSLDLRDLHAQMQAVVGGGFLVCAVVLGGSSASGYSANAIVQVAAVIAIAVTLGTAGGPARAASERQLLILAGLLAAVFLFQLVPLPPSLWTIFSGRKIVAEGLIALGDPLPWMPLSLVPERTVQSGLALLPPIAMILMMGAFPRLVARAAVLAVLAVMLVSVLLGVAQVAGSTRLYLYAYTNVGSAVGFFANTNHFGTLMCVTIPLTAGLVMRWYGRSDGDIAASRMFAAGVLLGIVMLALLGIIMTRSVAAVLLAVLAVGGSAAIVLPGLSRAARFWFSVGICVVVIVATGVAFSNGATDLGATTLDDNGLSRRGIWHVTSLAIGQFGMAGSGFGSFPHAFHLYENPETVTTMVVNHAHNDLLEFVLEGGIPGIAVLVAFLVWFGSRLRAVWGRGRRRDPMAQGASIAVSIILLHSLVDYPLRTAAIATIFGLCLALLAREGSDVVAETQLARHLSV